MSKLFTVLLIALTALVFVSCSPDAAGTIHDDVSQPTEPGLTQSEQIAFENLLDKFNKKAEEKGKKCRLYPGVEYYPLSEDERTKLVENYKNKKLEPNFLSLKNGKIFGYYGTWSVGSEIMNYKKTTSSTGYALLVECIDAVAVLYFDSKISK